MTDSAQYLGVGPTCKLGGSRRPFSILLIACQRNLTLLVILLTVITSAIMFIMYCWNKIIHQLQTS